MMICQSDIDMSSFTFPLVKGPTNTKYAFHMKTNTLLSCAQFYVIHSLSYLLHATFSEA